MINLKNKYITDYICIIILVFIYTVMSWLFFARQGHIIIDCGRDPYIAWQLLEGKVLYKDIFALYMPLSYQINTILFEIFGVHLNTLYFAGVFNGLIILLTLYFIFRSLSDKLVSTIICFSVMAILMFNYFHSGYLFPYAFAMIYGLSFLFLALLFLIYYIKFDSPKFLAAGFLFLGCAINAKIEFLPFLIVFCLTLFYKFPSKKHLFYSFFSFISIPLISWSSLILKGLNPAQVFDHFFLIKKFLNSKAVIYFYSNYTGLYFNLQKFFILIKEFFVFNTGFLIQSILIYLTAVFFETRYFKQNRFKKFIKLISILIIASILFILFNEMFISHYIFSWIGYTTVIFMLTYLSYLFIHKKYKFKSIDKNTFILLIVLISSVLALIRSVHFVNLHIFGTFFIPLSLWVNYYFFNFYSGKIRFLNKNLWKYSCLIVIISISSVIFIANYRVVKNIKNEFISTEYGKIFTEKLWSEAVKGTIDYINKNTSKDSTFIVFPQGIMLNFLSGRENPLKHLFYTPHSVELFEKQILIELKNNPPDLIAISNQSSKDLGYDKFGIDYGNNIFKFIEKNYEIKKVTGKKYKMILLKPIALDKR